MPRYYFDLKDGTRLVDPRGLECLDDKDAISKGTRIAQEVALGKPETDPQRYVAVIDAEGQKIAKIAVKTHR